jgi:hypothetical protein
MWVMTTMSAGLPSSAPQWRRQAEGVVRAPAPLAKLYADSNAEWVFG